MPVCLEKRNTVSLERLLVRLLNATNEDLSANKKPVWWPRDIDYGAIFEIRNFSLRSGILWRQTLLYIFKVYTSYFHKKKVPKLVCNVKRLRINPSLYSKHSVKNNNNQKNNSVKTKSSKNQKISFVKLFDILKEKNTNINNVKSKPETHVISISSPTVSLVPLERDTSLNFVNELNVRDPKERLNPIVKLVDILKLPHQKTWVNKDKFMSYLHLHNKNKPLLIKSSNEMRLRSSKFSYSIPFSSDIGKILLHKESTVHLEEIQQRKLERLEWYLKEQSKHKEDATYPVSYRSNRNIHVHNYSFPRRQFSQRRIVQENLLKLCKPVTVKLERLSLRINNTICKEVRIHVERKNF